MSNAVAAKETPGSLAVGGRRLNVPLVCLLIGALILAVPTLLFVAQESWSTEQGAHGPIVMATGAWLFWRLWSDARAVAQRPPIGRVWILLAVALPLYVFARVTQVVELEGYLMYATLIIALYSVVGAEAIKRVWFPLLYLAFMFPPPESLVAAATTPMKLELSRAAVALLNAFGYPIGSRGVMIYIGQYELLVAAACSGLNSIISLSAISLFYIYVRHQADWRYSALLALLVVPVALAANFVRVIVLILLTYHAGEAAAQGFLHNSAGIVLFAVALLFIFALDEAFQKLWAWHHARRTRGARA